MPTTESTTTGTTDSSEDLREAFKAAGDRLDAIERHKAAVAAAALRAYARGLNVIPTMDDRSKRPLGAWSEQISARPSREETEKAHKSAWGTGILFGNVWDGDALAPYGIELFEFDDADAYEAFLTAAGDDPVVGPVIDKIRDGYEETTPGDGVHLLYYCETVEGNQKLAQRSKRDDERRVLGDGSPDPEDTVKTLSETRGLGGFGIIHPSGGWTHPSGRPYVLRRGGLDHIATITTEERKALFDLARSFDELPRQSRQERREGERKEGKRSKAESRSTSRPGDDYNRRHSWDDVLVPFGWTKSHSTGAGVTYWRRPGAATDGHDATTNADDSDRLFVHSTSAAPLEAERYYTKFSALVVLRYGGNFRAAADDLRSQGYGGRGAERGDERPPLTFLTIDELRNRPRPSWMIQGLLRQASLAMLVGDFGTYKSFIALAWALALASGRDWVGHPVKGGAVAYVAAEGAGGQIDRLDAWALHEGCPLPDNFRILDQTIDLVGDNEPLLEALAEIEDLCLVVVDTVARTFVGNENLQEDANAYVAAADRIKAETGATVLLIHHNNRQGEYRGSTVIPGALDTMIGAEKTADGVRLSCLKMKDAEPFDPIYLQRLKVDLNAERGLEDDAGIDLDARSSLVFTVVGTTPSGGPERDPLKPSERKALQALGEAPQSWLAWTGWKSLVKVSQSTFSDAVAALLADDYVTKEESGKASYFQPTAKGVAYLAGDLANPFASEPEPPPGPAGEGGDGRPKGQEVP